MKILFSSIVDLKKSLHNRPHEFIKYLKEKHDLTIISINDWWKHQFSKGVNEFDPLFNDIKYIYLTDKKLSPILQEVFFKKKINELKKDDFDLYFNYNCLKMGSTLTDKFPTIMDISDDLIGMVKYSPQIPSILSPISVYFSQKLLNNNIKHANKIILTNSYLAQKFNIEPNKFEILPNGVDSNEFKFIKYAKSELNFEGFVLGYVGALREWVNFEPVFRALNALPKEINMVIVGDEGYFKENVYLSKKIGVNDRVRFIGRISYANVPRYISAMDVCLIPFHENKITNSSLPLKLFEYMSCGKPIISTNIQGVKKIAKENILYSTSTDSYIKNIIFLYKNNELMNDMGKKGRDLVINNFDWKQIFKKLGRILSN
jgi:glycosyltransferase involved in cell wall biosynthesis